MTLARQQFDTSRRVSRPDKPLPTLWTTQNRGHEESRLDCETAVSLACHLSPVFEAAKDWSALIDLLDGQGFRLVFQKDRLTLVNAATGINLCTCSVLGHGFARLKDRLGKPCVQAPSGRLR